MVECGFTLCTKYSLYLYTQNKKYPTKLPTPNFKKKKEKKKKNKTKARRGFSVFMVVGGLYNKGGDPLDSSFSLFQMFFQSQVFYFGNI